MPTRITAVRIDLAGDESHGAGASGQHGVSTRITLGCWARRAQGRESVAVAASPAPARARRLRRGVGVGAGALSDQEACDVRARARRGAHARRGDRHGLRPGTDWKRAAWRSLGRRHGWRRTRRPQLGSNARGNGGRWRSVHSPAKRAALPPRRLRAQGNPPR
jgi:hypothetical protein